MKGVKDNRTNQVLEMSSSREMREIALAKASYNSTYQPPFTIPRDPQEFYEDLGFPFEVKDKNGMPKRARKLTDYQIMAWKEKKNLLVVKSNKIGLTSSFLLEDIQSRLLPEEAGYDLLLSAQSDEQAFEHIKTATDILRNSRKYSQFLDERKSNSGTLTIKNPYNPRRSSRIIGLGSSIKAVFSWKRVNRIHMSDVSLLPLNGQKEFFGGLYSRLANTNGTIKIESIPMGQEGEVFRIYNNWMEAQGKKIKIKDSVASNVVADPKKLSTSFKVFEYPAELAVKAGIISKEFLANQKLDLGELMYQQLYGCKFIASGNQWYKVEWFSKDTGAPMSF